MTVRCDFPSQGAGEVGLRARNVVDVFRGRAVAHPDRVAFTFLGGDDAADAQARTYAQLDQEARAIAAHLQQICRPGDRALLMYDSGLEYIAALAGCLYAGVVAVPVFAPDPLRVARTMPRLEAIVHDAQAKLLLGSSSNLAWAGALLGGIPGLGQLLPSDRINAKLADRWVEPQLDRQTPAFLQYTSGSTGQPKGVLVRHGSVLANLGQMEAMLDVENAIACTWLPAYHDMGLVGGIFQCWYSGRHNVLMSPLAFFQHPLRWLRAVAEYRATTVAAPDFAYDLCVRKIKPEERRDLDLSCLQVILSGAEPVRAATIERFVDAFASCGVRREAFRPCYGMAEATLLISAAREKVGPVVNRFDADGLTRNRAVPVLASEARANVLVGCGRPPVNQRVEIVDPATCCVLTPGQIGEIWVAGANVASEYWGKPVESAATFQAFTADGSGPFLRTGDLGFVHDGELYISGRCKDLIIVRGRNYYPQDLELSIESCHAAIKPCAGAAFSVEVEGREQLVVVQEVARPNKVDLEEVARAVRRALFDAHDLIVDAVVLIRAGSIAKTTSGKIQRHACRERYLRGEFDVVHSCVSRSRRPSPEAYVAPRTALEAQLAEVWTDVLGVERVGAFDNFFDLGGTSLLATQMVNRLTPQLDVAIPLTELFDRPTIAQLADLISTERARQHDEDADLLELLDNMSEEEAAIMLRSGESSSAPAIPASEQAGGILHGKYIAHMDQQPGFTSGTTQL